MKCVLNGLSRKSRNPFTAERSQGQNSANSPYLFFLHCMPWNVLQSLFLAARYCIKKYGRTPLNTDTSFGQFSLSLGKALSFVSCPINRFSQKINLINADTSLSVLFCNRSFLNSFMNLEKSFSWQHLDVPSTTVARIGWFVVVNFRLFWHPSSHAENSFD